MIQKLVFITGANEQQVSGGNRWQVLGGVQIMEEEGQIKKGQKVTGASDTHDPHPPNTVTHQWKITPLPQSKPGQGADIQALRPRPFPFSSWVKHQSGLLPPFGINVWSLIRGLQQILENLPEHSNYPPEERRTKDLQSFLELNPKILLQIQYLLFTLNKSLVGALSGSSWDAWIRICNFLHTLPLALLGWCRK